MQAPSSNTFFVGLPHLREQPQVCLHTVLLLRLFNACWHGQHAMLFSSEKMKFESGVILG